ncbi:MAG: ECF transporter S component [Lachnospiraceae bacterium]|jgi:riboflavin transporter FmnP
METKTNSTTASKKKMSVRNIAVTAMLSAIAFILMYLEIAIPIMPSFIKFDFSDLPALLGSFALGPLYGAIICFIKNVLHLAVSQSMFVGELSNFILAVLFVVPAGLIYKKKKTKKRALIGGLVGMVVMGVLSLVTNYFVVYPVYYNFMPKETIIAAYDAISFAIAKVHMTSIGQCLLIFNVPFTMLKTLISVVISMIIYKPLSPILRGKHNR